MNSPLFFHLFLPYSTDFCSFAIVKPLPLLISCEMLLQGTQGVTKWSSGLNVKGIENISSLFKFSFFPEIGLTLAERKYSSIMEMVKVFFTLSARQTEARGGTQMSWIWGYCWMCVSCMWALGTKLRTLEDSTHFYS